LQDKNFSREIYNAKTCKRQKFAKKKEHALSLQTLLYSCLKFVSPRMRFAVKILKENKENHKKSKKHICLAIYNSRLQLKILTEMIAKHYSIMIAYYL